MPLLIPISQILSLNIFILLWIYDIIINKLLGRWDIMDTSKIIDVLCQIVGGGVVGIITYWISSKLWPASKKKMRWNIH
jgi:hypothetical protein